MKSVDSQKWLPVLVFVGFWAIFALCQYLDKKEFGVARHHEIAKQPRSLFFLIIFGVIIACWVLIGVCSRFLRLVSQGFNAWKALA